MALAQQAWGGSRSAVTVSKVVDFRLPPFASRELRRTSRLHPAAHSIWKRRAVTLWYGQGLLATVSPYLIRRREVALVRRGNTAFNRLGETRIVIEKARDGLLSELIDVASVTRRNRDKTTRLTTRRTNSLLAMF